MNKSIATRLLLAALLVGAPLATTQAASVFLTPASVTTNLGAGTVTLELFMDFTGVQTLGGGIDLNATGPITIQSFTPSAYFTGTADPAFTGFGTAQADADFEIHFGSFSGLTGLNKLGDLTIGLGGLGLANVGLAINSFYGGFVSLTGAAQQVTLTGAQINVVPVPAAVWLFGSAMGLLGWLRRPTAG